MQPEDEVVRRIVQEAAGSGHAGRIQIPVGVEPVRIAADEGDAIVLVAIGERLVPQPIRRRRDVRQRPGLQSGLEWGIGELRRARRAEPKRARLAHRSQPRPGDGFRCMSRRDRDAFPGAASWRRRRGLIFSGLSGRLPRSAGALGCLRGRPQALCGLLQRFFRFVIALADGVDPLGPSEARGCRRLGLTWGGRR
jgi:hypothetical protein